MAVNILNSNYNGEVLEQLLTLAATGNELVEKNLIHIEPNVSLKFSIPRLKTGTMLQKRKEQPEDSDSKGDFNYSEKELKPVDFMAFTTFNPRSFEKIWRQWQPKGNLVFSELPPEGQNALLAALAKQVTFELGWHFICGQYGTTDKELFYGILYRMLQDTDVLKVTSSATTMIGKLTAVKAKIPKVLRENPNLKILMSIDDFDTYDTELTQQPNKGANYTDMNVERFKGIAIAKLANWPSGCIVATICSMDLDSNLWAAVNLQDDMDVIQIDKLTNAGERYFFKMLMKADTNIAFGEEVVLLDTNTVSAATAVDVVAAGETKTVSVTASYDWSVAVDGTTSWFTVTQNGDNVSVVVAANTGIARTGTFTITLDLFGTTAQVTVSQAAGA